jgi:superfamily I DNA and/or RNA helicase
VVRRVETLIARAKVPPEQIAVIALCPAQVELLRAMLEHSAPLRQASAVVPVYLPGAVRQQEFPVVLVSLTRSNAGQAVSFGEGPHALTLSLTRACRRLILFGDPGTCVRRSQWQGALDHLDEQAAAREAQVFTRLVSYLQGRGRHAAFFHLSEGSKV